MIYCSWPGRHVLTHRVVVDVGDGAGEHRLLAHQRRHVEGGGAGVYPQLAPAAALAAAGHVMVTTRAAIERFHNHEEGPY